jgi:hypothetical protein
MEKILGASREFNVVACCGGGVGGLTFAQCSVYFLGKTKDKYDFRQPRFSSKYPLL